MTTTTHRDQLAALDELTGPLEARARTLGWRAERLADLGRAVATVDSEGGLYLDGHRVCATCLTDDCTLEHHSRTWPPPPPVPTCQWCGAGEGCCELSGGTSPCEGLPEYRAAMAEAAAAPCIGVVRAGAS